MYTPKPLDTSKVVLPGEITELAEKLSENVHEVWAENRLRDGWVYGKKRSDKKKTHPGLVAYEDLPEREKDYDRDTMCQTLKSLYVLGYKIVKDE